jgi:hypothetical protein
LNIKQSCPVCIDDAKVEDIIVVPLIQKSIKIFRDRVARRGHEWVEERIEAEFG